MKLINLPLLLILLFITALGNSQTKVDKSTATDVKAMKDEGTEIKEGWTHGVSINAAFNQASLTNWFSGGENFSMGLNSVLKANAIYKKKKNLFKSSFEGAYGLLSSTSTGGIRKTDDRWVLTSSLNTKSSKNFYYTLAGQLKSQFANGYSYTNNVRNEILSAPFAPGDVKLGIGITYQKNSNFSAYISPLTAKINLKYGKAFLNKSIFGVDSGKTSAFDLGAFVRLDYTKELKKDLKYTGSLDAFYGYVLRNYNFYFANMINWKLNKYFGATVGLDIAFDNTQPSYTYPTIGGIVTKTEGKAKMQYKQLFGLGFNYSF